MFDILESGFADVRFACFGPRVRPTNFRVSLFFPLCFPVGAQNRCDRCTLGR